MKRNNDPAFEKGFEIARDVHINLCYTSLQAVRNETAFSRKTVFYYTYNNGTRI